MDDSYFDEVMPFNDPNDLENKFDTLETQNLFYITRLQDMEAQLEDMRDMERKRRSKRDQEYNKQLEYKLQIDEEIAKQQRQLDAIAKSSKGVQFDDGDHNIDQMLDKLRSTI